VTTSTVEDYLKAILLEQQRTEGELVNTGRIASAVGVAPGTATAMVKALADSGLVSYEPYIGAGLTDRGRQLAMRVLRRHRLVELFLVRVMEMDWSEVHDEAERLEHAVSDRVIARMDEMLGHPSTDPHGDPIPDSHGVVVEPVPERLNLFDCPVGRPMRVLRVSDQSPAFLQLVEKRGLMPGTRLVVDWRSEAAEAVELSLLADPASGRPDAERMTLGGGAAAKIEVAPLTEEDEMEPAATAAGGAP
jgi:DtxR family Mn-dependent transcriptional regulator